MNANYPTLTSDYDYSFLKRFLCAIFKKPDLKQCGRTGMINQLDRCKLKFVKGTSVYEYIFSILKLHISI